MKKLFVLILSVLCFTSCKTHKEILHPYVKFEISDSLLKTPLSNVNLFHANDIKLLNKQVTTDKSSDEKGILIIPKTEVNLVGTAQKIMPFTSIKYVFKKNGYKDFNLDLHTYFKIDSKKDYKKKYNANIFLVKLDSLSDTEMN